MIEIDKVSKRYANGHEALKQVSFHIRKGEMAFLTGHSGAGKSTLLKLMLGLEKPSSGHMLVHQKNVHQLSHDLLASLRRDVGMIWQSPMLLTDRNVFENVELPLLIAGLPTHDRYRRVRAALDKVGLLSKEKLYPIDLSGGEQQRLSIARAIVNKPKIILADEPTGNLDPVLSLQIMQLFSEFNQVGVTVLIASHDLTLIARLNHRIITLKEGVLINDGSQ